MKLICILLLLFATSELVSPGKHCIMTTSKLSCAYDPTEERSLFIRENDIKALDFSGRIMTGVVRASVKDYKNLEELSLANCRIRRLDNGTFSELPKLIKLNLSDNLITNFNGFSFDNPNVLNILILSNNLLISLNDLHLEAFPRLRVIDVRGNQLKYLPEEVIYKLRDNPTFLLYSSNNPWNCVEFHWRHHLETNADLKNKFCNSKSNFISLMNGEEKHGTLVRQHCGFVKCHWWIIGSVWIGVILGNLNKLNKLLYRSKCRRKKAFEKAVGTENEVHHLVRQERIAFGMEETELKSRS